MRVRRRAAEAGREPRQVLIFNMQTAIVDETDARAQSKWQSYASYEGALALISGWTGIDFRAHESFRDVVGLLVPELQQRGAYKTE